MKTKILLLVLFFLATKVADAQIMFERTYGGINGDGGYSVTQTNDNGYIIVGRTYSYGFGSADVYLIKTDEYGDTLWTKIYGDTNSNVGLSVLQTNDGGYIVVGKTQISTDIVHTFIIKTDINGDTLWTKTLGNLYNIGYSIQQTNDNGYVIVGEKKDNYNYVYESDVYLVKINENADTLWTRSYGGPYEYSSLNNDFGKSVLQTNDNGFIIAGGTGKWGYGGVSKIYIIKTDVNGDTLWTKTYGDYDWCEAGANSIVKTDDNGYVICGYSNNHYSSDPDVFIKKIDSSGNQQWNKTFGGIYRDEGLSIYRTNDNGYIVTGYCSYNPYTSDMSDADLYLIKTDINGDTLWTRTYGGPENDFGYSVQQTNDNGYIICGSTSSFGNGSSDVYLIKTDANGLSTSINEITDSDILQIYPNPNSGAFNIKVQNENKEEMSIEIINVNGQVVYKKQLNKTAFVSEKIELSNCSKGIYFVKVQNENIINVKKIITY